MVTWTWVVVVEVLRTGQVEDVFLWYSQWDFLMDWIWYVREEEPVKDDSSVFEQMEGWAYHLLRWKGLGRLEDWGC